MSTRSKVILPSVVVAAVVAVAAAVLLVAGCGAGARHVGLSTSSMASLKNPKPPSGGASLAQSSTALQGTPVSTVADAQSLANSAINVPDVSVVGQPTKIVVWAPNSAHPEAPIASQARAQVAIGLLYPNGAVLTAVPISDPSVASDLASQFAAMASQPTTENTWPFTDGRKHVAVMQTVNGRETLVEQSGVAYQPGHPDSDVAVPSTVDWIENGISYQVRQPSLPVDQLVKIAAAVK